MWICSVFVSSISTLTQALAFITTIIFSFYWNGLCVTVHAGSKMAIWQAENPVYMSTVICIQSASILFPICTDHNLFPVSKRYPRPGHLHCIISSTMIKTGNIDFVSVGSWNDMSRLVWNLPWLSSDWAFLARLHQIVYPLLWVAALPEWLSLWLLCKSYWLFETALLLSGSLIVSIYKNSSHCKGSHHWNEECRLTDDWNTVYPFIQTTGYRQSHTFTN